MRVIRGPEYQFQCPGCRALLGVSGADIIVDETGHSHYYSVKCPCCGKRSGLPADRIPSAVKNEIDELD